MHFRLHCFNGIEGSTWHESESGCMGGLLMHVRNVA